MVFLKGFHQNIVLPLFTLPFGGFQGASASRGRPAERGSAASGDPLHGVGAETRDVGMKGWETLFHQCFHCLLDDSRKNNV